MDKEEYFVFTCDEDGVSIHIYTKSELEKDLQLEEGEECNAFGTPGYLTLDELKKNKDPWYWEENLLIIKGEVMIPEVTEIVKKMRIE